MSKTTGTKEWDNFVRSFGWFTTALAAPAAIFLLVSALAINPTQSAGSAERQKLSAMQKSIANGGSIAALGTLAGAGLVLSARSSRKNNQPKAPTVS